MKQLFQRIEALLRNQADAVLCSIVASSGSVPRGAGAKMLVLEDGSTLGTIGGGTVEFKATQLGVAAIGHKQSFLQEFALHPQEIADIGMVCGGEVSVYFQYFSCTDPQQLRLVSRINEALNGTQDAWLITQMMDAARWSMGIYTEEQGLEFLACDPALLRGAFHSHSHTIREADSTYFVEPLVQASRVYIFGGGHVSRALVPVLVQVGFSPVVFEDRAEFARQSLFPTAAEVLLGSFSHIAQTVSILSRDYVVIMTRGHQADYEVLFHALKTEATYIGMIGSRKKMAHTRQRLQADGFTDADISRIHNPIGLAIRAETPEEIAISVAGELILHRATLRQP